MKKFCLFFGVTLSFVAIMLIGFFGGAFSNQLILNQAEMLAINLQQEENEQKNFGATPEPFLMSNEEILNTEYYKSVNVSGGSLADYYCMRDYYTIFSANQADYGLCWAFAFNKTIETSLAISTNEYYNLSESWVGLLANQKSNALLGAGGNWYMAQNYTFGGNGEGFMLESDFEYDDFYKLNSNNATSFYNKIKPQAINNMGSCFTQVPFTNYNNYLQQSERKFQQDIVKNHIQNYSAVYCSINVGPTSNYPIEDENGNYILYSELGSSNHAVTIIGWDDDFVVNYDKNGDGDTADTISEDGDTIIEATTTGAWIVLNSWGNAWGEDGIFYVAYDDVHVSDGMFGMQYQNDLNFYATPTSSNGNFTNNLKNAYNNTQIEQPTTGTNRERNIFASGSEVSLTYTYSSLSSINANQIEVEILKNGKSCLSSFNVTKNEVLKTILITSGATLQSGGYKILLKADLDNDHNFDVILNKQIFVLTGAEYATVYQMDYAGSAEEGYTSTQGRVSNFNSFIDGQNVISIIVDQNDNDAAKYINSGLNNGRYGDVLIALPTYSTISAISTENENLKILHNIYSANRFTPATASTYAKGYICLTFHNLLNGKNTFTLTANTISGGSFMFNFNVTYTNNVGTPIYVDYAMGSQEVNAITNPTLISTESDSVVLDTPTKQGYIFRGWFFDSEFTMPVSQNESDQYYISAADATVVAGTNSLGSDGMRFITLYPMFLREFTITTSANEYGTISPAGETVVLEGDSLIINFTPNANCEIEEIFVDGISLGVVDSCTFSNIIASHTVTAVFKQTMVTVTLPTQTNFEIELLSQSTLQKGSTFSFKVNLDLAYNRSVISVMANGQALTADEDGIYSFVVNENVNLVINNVQLNRYSITFKNWDDSIIQVNNSDTQMVNHGGIITVPNTPSRPATAQYSYLFDGWYNEDEFKVTDFTATKDIVLKAQYTSRTNSYLVQFSSASEYSLQKLGGGTMSVEYGSTFNFTILLTAPYSNCTPTIKANGVILLENAGEYSFVVTEATTITVSNLVKNIYTVRFEDFDGSLILINDSPSVSIQHGNVTQTPANPTRAHYSFVGWYQKINGEVSTILFNTDTALITQDTVLVAGYEIDRFNVYLSSGQYYSMESYQEQNTQNVAYGTIFKFTVSVALGHSNYTVYASGIAVTPNEGIYSITVTQNTFIMVNVEGADRFDVTLQSGDNFDIVFEDGYNQTGISYGSFVRFKVNVDEAYSKSQLVVTATSNDEYGAQINTVLHKNSAGVYSVQVLNPVLIQVGNLSINTYSVTFKDADENIITAGGLQVQNVLFGGEAIVATAPELDHYNFDNWYTHATRGVVIESFSNIRADITAYARYTPKSYSVTFKNDDGTVIQVSGQDSQSVFYNALANAPTPPVRAHYVFSNWVLEVAGEVTDTAFDANEDAVSGNMILRAVYVLEQHTISLTNATGASLVRTDGRTGKVDYGATLNLQVVLESDFSTCRNALKLLLNGVRYSAKGDGTFDVIVEGDGEVTILGVHKNFYTISTGTSTQGTYSPAGATNVTYGFDQTYIITPSTGYEITKLFIDNVLTTFSSSSIDANGSLTYVFEDVIADHLIKANFKLIEYSITIEYDNGAGAENLKEHYIATYGSSRDFHISSSAFYTLKEVYINGTLGTLDGDCVSVEDIKQNLYIRVVFEKDPSAMVIILIFCVSAIFVLTAGTLFIGRAVGKNRLRKLQQTTLDQQLKKSKDVNTDSTITNINNKDVNNLINPAAKTDVIENKNINKPPENKN